MYRRAWRGCRLSAVSSQWKSASRQDPVGPFGQHRYLRFERLEERLDLAVLTVNSLSDAPVNLTDVTVTLRDAIRAANDNVQVSPGGATGSGADEIRFQAGLSGSILLNVGQLEVSDDLTITGPGANALTINGSNASIIFVITDQSANAKAVTITGVTISNGHNLAGSGGAIFNAENLTVENCVVSGNTSQQSGGGIFNLGTLTVRATTISDNATVAPGADGGGLWSNGPLTVENSTISENTAGRGSGIFSDSSGALTVRDSTISGNRANASAGGIFSNGGPLTVLSSTITQNHTYNVGGSNTPNTGGGIFFDGSTGSSSPTLHNTIVADNFKGSGTTVEDNIDRPTGATVGATGTNNLLGTVNALGFTNGVNGNQVGVADPLLGSLANNGGPTKTHGLLPGSPALNSGNVAQAGFSSSDQRGAPFLRVFGGLDIGAFEAQPMTVVVDTDADETDGNEGPGHLSLREAINRTNANIGADTITFASDFFNVSRVISLGLGQFGVTDDLAITGPGADLLTINGNNASIMFVITDQQFAVSKTVTFRGLTLTAARNMAGSGGAIFNAENLTVLECAITGNSAQISGGGIFNLNTGNLTLRSSTISGNSANSAGGGVYSTGALVIENTTISGNRANASGAGLANSGTTAVLRNATITQNHSDNNNSGSEPGGGVFVVSGAVTLHNTIVADNYRGSGTSTEDDIGGSVSGASTNNLIGTGGAGGLTNGTNGNQVGVTNPLLGPLADNGGPTSTHALLPGSLSIDKGNNAQAPIDVLTDQRGAPFARIVNTTIDIGAIEAQPAGPSLPGDYNQNGFVDAADYVLWRKTLGAIGIPAFSGADGDGDGTVDQADYSVWRAHFGQSLPMGAGAGNGAAASNVVGVGIETRLAESNVMVPRAIEKNVATVVALDAFASRDGRIGRSPYLGDRPIAEATFHDAALLVWLDSRDTSRQDAMKDLNDVGGHVESLASDPGADEVVQGLVAEVANGW